MSNEADVPAHDDQISTSPVMDLLSRLPARWVALGLLVIIVVVVVLLRGDGADTPDSPLATLAPLEGMRCETIISSGDVQVAASPPVTVTLEEQSFPVAPMALGEEAWIYPAEYSGYSAWVCGTVVNYVIGLEPTRDNERLLDSLNAGDLIELHLANGSRFLFRYDDDSEELAADEPSIFEQSEPAITLLVEVDDGLLLVVRALYETSSEPLQPVDVGDPVALNTVVQVGDAQITVFDGYALRDVPELAQGTMYFLVELKVENTGNLPLQTRLFDMVLEDGNGSIYLLSRNASEVGFIGPFDGEIEPGGVASGSAGYLVPDSLEGPTLLWTFSPWPTSGVAAQVLIPYEQPPILPGSVTVNIDDAFLNVTGNELIIVGGIRNDTSSTLTILATDIRLSSSAGAANLRMAAPMLPWMIEPGQYQVIELQYDTPIATSAVLTILGYSFEIGGLPGSGGFGGP